MNIEITLDERGTTYGGFNERARVAQEIQDHMRAQSGWLQLSPVQRQALTVMADKVSRILCGNPNYPDNWHDIQGYAKLAEDDLPVAHAVANDNRSQRFMTCVGCNTPAACDAKRGCLHG